MDFVSGLISGVDWKALPGQIVTAIKGVLTGFNWAGAFTSLGNLAGTIFKALFDIGAGLADVFGNIATDIADYFSEHLQLAGFDQNKSLIENGKAILFGILNGIIEGIAEIGMWIHDNILEPFVTAFMNVFKMGSPAKISAIVDLGKYLIEGVFNGIIEWMSGVKDWVKKNVLDKFSEAFDNAKEITISIGGKITDTFTKMKEAYDSIKDKVAELTGKAKDAMGSAYDKLKGAWETVKTKTAELTGKAKDSLGSAYSSIKEAWDTVKSKIATLTGQAKNNLGSAYDTIKNAWAAIKSKTATLTAKALNKMGKVAQTISSIWSSINNKTATLTATFKDLFSKAFKTVWNGLVKGINNGIDIINKIPGVNITPLKPIPLAKGAVIPPNKEFLAMLGDQKHGTNIEAPLDTIVEAFNKALNNRQDIGSSSSSGDIVLQLNGSEIARAVWQEEDKRYKQTASWDRRK